MTVESRLTEIRYKGSDVAKMLNRWLVNDVCQTWTEDFVDKDTGETVSVGRSQVLFERGTLVTQDVASQIRFFQQEGSIKELEVSNQHRKGYPLENTHLWPFFAVAQIDRKKVKFLLSASGVANALTILNDYIELNYSGGFGIESVSAYKPCIILIDTLDKMDADDNTDTDDDTLETEKYYQISTTISDGVEVLYDQLFIVKSCNVDKAMLVINAYLTEQERKRMEKVRENNPDTDEQERIVIASIEEVKSISVGDYIPLEFSMAYNEK